MSTYKGDVTHAPQATMGRRHYEDYYEGSSRVDDDDAAAAAVESRVTTMGHGEGGVGRHACHARAMDRLMPLGADAGLAARVHCTRHRRHGRRRGRGTGSDGVRRRPPWSRAAGVDGRAVLLLLAAVVVMPAGTRMPVFVRCRPLLGGVRTYAT